MQHSCGLRQLRSQRHSGRQAAPRLQESAWSSSMEGLKGFSFRSATTLQLISHGHPHHNLP